VGSPLADVCGRAPMGHYLREVNSVPFGAQRPLYFFDRSIHLTMWRRTPGKCGLGIDATLLLDWSRQHQLVKTAPQSRSGWSKRTTDAIFNLATKTQSLWAPGWYYSPINLSGPTWFEKAVRYGRLVFCAPLSSSTIFHTILPRTSSIRSLMYISGSATWDTYARIPQ
jgi:hypothetical protein